MLDIERWVKWGGERGFRIVTPDDLGRCDICVKAIRGNSWMNYEPQHRGIDVTVCKEHAQEYGLLW